MIRHTVLALAAVAVLGSGYLAAQARILQQGRAIVEYRSPQVNAVAAYEYSHRNHNGEWLLVEFAVQAKDRIVIHRDELSLLTPDERSIPVATQEQYLGDHAELTQLMQNATIWRRPLGVYFLTPPQPTINFYASPGRIVSDEAVTNLDEVAAGDLLFKSPDGRWRAGEYRLVLDHEKAQLTLPIVLK